MKDLTDSFGQFKTVLWHLGCPKRFWTVLHRPKCEHSRRPSCCIITYRSAGTWVRLS